MDLNKAINLKNFISATKSFCASLIMLCLIINKNNLCKTCRNVENINELKLKPKYYIFNYKKYVFLNILWNVVIRITNSQKLNKFQQFNFDSIPKIFKTHSSVNNMQDKLLFPLKKTDWNIIEYK